MAVLPAAVKGWISLGVCVLGKNLNSFVLRGNTAAVALAAISGPDTIDPIRNPNGTQRALKSKHSVEAGAYALGVNAAGGALQGTRIFPEVILNVRDMDIVRLRDVVSGKAVSYSAAVKSLSQGSRMLLVEIKQSALAFPVSRFNPQISRVDGNHRLSRFSELFQSEQLTLENSPVIPFALYMGLSVVQEMKIFIDINANHKGMPTNLLISAKVRIDDGKSARDKVDEMASYLAVKLSETSIFAGLIDTGGDLSGYANLGMAKPEISLTQLKVAVRNMMQKSPLVALRHSTAPDQYLGILEAYFSAVRTIFPGMWADRKNYILFKSIGLMALGHLGGYLLNEMSEKDKITSADFRPALQKVGMRLDLRSTAWKGIAGAAGGQKVYESMLESLR